MIGYFFSPGGDVKICVDNKGTVRQGRLEPLPYAAYSAIVTLAPFYATLSLLILLQSHWPPPCSLNSPSTLLPQAFTQAVLCLDTLCFLSAWLIL